MASNFTFMADFLKDLGSFLDEANTSNASVEEISLRFDTERKLLVTEVAFFVPLGGGDKECIVGKSVIEEKYLSQYSDDFLIKQVVGDIIVDVEEQLLTLIDDGVVDIQVH